MNEYCERIIIDYDGENIKNHQMDIDDFVQSITGFADLLKIVAKELEFPEEAIQIRISPLEQGSLKAVINACLIFAGGYVATNFSDGLGIGDRIKHWGSETATFLSAKRDEKIDSNNIAQKSMEATFVQGKLLQNKSAHQAVTDIVKCLEKDAETIDVIMEDQDIHEHLERSNVENLKSNPFNEPADVAEESVHEERMQLYLENVGIVGTKWTFYEKKSEKSKRRITAEVLDPNLLRDARNSSLEEKYKDVPLLCTVRIKVQRKQGARRMSPPEFYILDCQKDEPLSLFPTPFPENNVF